MTDSDTTNESQTTKGGVDLKQLLENLKLPGVDAKVLLEGRRKDIEALLEANERAFVGVEALTRKQIETFSEIMHEWQQGTKDLLANEEGSKKAEHLTNQAQQAVSHALNHMIEMAEIAAQSNNEVRNILEVRYRNALTEFRDSLRKKE